MSDESRLLFDIPGPRATRRTRIATGVALLALTCLLALVVRQFAIRGQLDADQWSMYTQWPILRYLLEGVGQTLLVTAVAATLTFPLGAAVALLRLSRSRMLRAVARGYTELFRAVPLLLLLYVFLFGLPRAGLTFPVFWQLVIPIVLSNAAVVCELLRAGVLAQDRGQGEAAQSLGMTYWQSMRWVILPQAVLRLVPALVSQLVRLLKDSTLGYTVSFLELLHRTRVLGEYYHTVLSSYLVAAACYVLISAALSRTADRLEQRQRQ
ncbi:amino acid ABC transporter permease [Kitasatospora herbaricolor]|uniref:amino acid ABC transporter permease n=1 Tax=Kitasatospora herbaricolor TaxID=68217 RepID=UPI0036DBE60B